MTPASRRRPIGGWAGRAALIVTAAIPLAFLAIFFVVPVAGMIGRGVLVDGQLDLGGFTEVFSRSRTARVIAFTLGMSAAATVITILVGLPTAYTLYRLRMPFARAVRSLVMMPFVMPTVVVGVMFRSLLAPGGFLGWLGLDGSWVAILAAFVFFNLAVVVRTVGGAWEALDPRTQQSAAALGASPWVVFRTVTFPALAPAVVSAASVVFLFCSTAFGVVLTLGGMRYGTVETEIYLLTTTLLDLRGAAALSVVQLLAVGAMLWVSGRARTRAEGAADGRGSWGARRGAPAARLPVTRAAVGPLLISAAAVVFLATPIVSLVVRSFRRDGDWSSANYVALSAVSDRNALPVSVWQALGTSWRIAVDAALLAMVLGLAVSVVVSRRSRSAWGRRTLSFLDGAFMLPLGISAVTVGFGFLITLDRPPLDLRSSPILIPIAQAMVALPLVVRTVAPALRGIDDRQRQAAAALGASPIRVLLSVDLPLVWRPVLAGTGFALAVSLGEFGATSFLARPDNPTVPVVIYQLIGRPGAENFGMSLAASVVLSVVTVTVLGLVERLHVGQLGSFG